MVLTQNRIGDHEMQSIDGGVISSDEPPKKSNKLDPGTPKIGSENDQDEKDKNLKEVRDRYLSSFTMHALNHIVEGTRLEKVLWTLKLLTALGIAVYLALNFFISYFNYEVNTTIKMAPKMSMKLPILYLCNDGYWSVLRTLSNCTIGSRKYQDRICKKMREPRPYWYSDGTRYCGNYEDDNLICTRKDPLLANQCVVLNPELKNLQKESSQKMTKELTIIWDQNSNLPFPIQLWINPVEADWKFGQGSYSASISQPGKYEFAMEKTVIKRLPAPYSSPSCIQQDTTEALEKNLFRGRYTREKCEESCALKHGWLKCGVVLYHYRLYIRDKNYLKPFLNESIIDPDKETKSCWDPRSMNRNKWLLREKIISDCKATCYQPCDEERFKISEVSNPWSANEERRHQQKQPGRNIKKVRISVYYRELMEMEITETPSYDGVTLLANFGGMLGLMTGMSALSVLEILVWALLCTIVLMKHQ